MGAQHMLDELCPKQPEQPAAKPGASSTAPADQAPICPISAIQSVAALLNSNQMALDNLFVNEESGGRMMMNNFFERIGQAVQINDTIKQVDIIVHRDELIEETQKKIKQATEERDLKLMNEALEKVIEGLNFLNDVSMLP